MTQRTRLTDRESPPQLLEWLIDDRLAQWLDDQQQPRYRAGQIARWIFHHRAMSIHDMTDLPLGLRETMAGQFSLWQSDVVRHQCAADGSEKLLLELKRGGEIECVLLRDGARRSICISTQIGCAMGCVFCASGLDGIQRNLSAGEIVEQMLRLTHLLPVGERISHVVVMGMGEPLANLDALLLALGWATRKDGLAISCRRITISTVGLPAAIYRLIDSRPFYHLAVSLHAPEDGLRNQLVPVNRHIGLAAILSAADAYFDASGRRLTFEYVLLAGVNDQPQYARQLGQLLATRHALLNVIPYNPVQGLPYRTPSPAQVRDFCGILEGLGVNVQVRRRKGDAILAACGQLRRTATAETSTAVRC